MSRLCPHAHSPAAGKDPTCEAQAPDLSPGKRPANAGLRTVATVDGIRYALYKPRGFRWYYSGYPEYRKPTFKHAVRMFIERLRGGYHVWYMLDAESGRVCGYLVVARGGRRLSCSSRQDIVIGPVWICPALRGKGLGTKGIRAVLLDLGERYRYAWEYIKTHNIASIRSVEKNGFERFSFGRESRWFRTVWTAASGQDVIYRYVPANNGSMQ